MTLLRGHVRGRGSISICDIDIAARTEGHESLDHVHMTLCVQCGTGL